ncbi:TPA: transposase [Staphylococcus aureus]|nr:transposase [Staphylococcus aureus]HEK6246824.1 transposase [Staphylococcus aureus]
MEKFNRQEQLKQLHAERKVKTEKKVDKAINDLVQKNKAINFNIVSKHSKVSKATLYKNNKIRKKIEKLREQNREIFVHKNKNKNDGKDALISSLKRKVNSLEKEKKMLKEEISVLYSRLYEDI